MDSFQCKICWIQHVKGHSNDLEKHKYKGLFTFMIRLNLDIFGGNKVFTVQKNLATLSKGVYLYEYLNLYLPHKLWRNFPLGDNPGFVIALKILISSK